MKYCEYCGAELKPGEVHELGHFTLCKKHYNIANKNDDFLMELLFEGGYDE